MFKYSTRINSFLRNGQPLRDALKEIGRIDGLSYVDMNYPEHFHGLTVGQIGEILSENALKLNAVNMRFRSEYLGGAFDNADPAVRRSAIDLCMEGDRVCHELGGDQLIIWLGYDGYDYSFQKDYPASWRNVCAGFTEVCRYSKGKVSVEYKPYEERAHAIIDSWGSAYMLVNSVGSTNFGVTLDFCHMLMKKENPAFAAALLLEDKKLFGIHVNDGEGSVDDGLITGSVHPWKTLELFYYLKKYSYDGVIYFDTFPKREPASEESALNLMLCQRLEEIVESEGVGTIASLIDRNDGIEATRFLLSKLI